MVRIAALKSRRGAYILMDSLAALRAEMDRRELDGYLVLNRMDQYWLTGFTGEDGLALVTPRAVVLLTDGRFDEAADIQAPYARKVLRKERTPQVNAAIIRRYEPEQLGFDPGQMSVSEHAALRKHVKPTKLVAATGLVAGMRVCKDAREVRATRKAIDVAQKAFLRVRKWIRPGRTELEVAARLEYEMRMLGPRDRRSRPSWRSGRTARCRTTSPATWS